MLRAAPQYRGVAFNILGNIMTNNDTTIETNTDTPAVDTGLDQHLALPVGEPQLAAHQNDEGAAETPLIDDSWGAGIDDKLERKMAIGFDAVDDDAALAAADIIAAADGEPAHGEPVDTNRPGNKANPLPDISAGNATTTAAPAADKSNRKGGKGAKAKAKATTAAAPAVTAPAETETETDPDYLGYRMHLWPTWGNAVKPSRAAILYVRAAGVYKHNTSNELAIASYVEAGGKPETRGMFNYYDVGEMVSKVQNSMPDHKAHTARRLCISLGWGLLRQVSPVPYKTPEKLGETGGRMSYYIVPFELDANGKVKTQIKAEKRRAIYGYIESKNETVPAWLKSPDDVK